MSSKTHRGDVFATDPSSDAKLSFSVLKNLCRPMSYREAKAAAQKRRADERAAAAVAEESERRAFKYYGKDYAYISSVGYRMEGQAKWQTYTVEEGDGSVWSVYRKGVAGGGAYEQEMDTQYTVDCIKYSEAVDRGLSFKQSATYSWLVYFIAKATRTLVRAAPVDKSAAAIAALSAQVAALSAAQAAKDAATAQLLASNAALSSQLLVITSAISRAAAAAANAKKK